jgi:hypothetical protein
MEDESRGKNVEISLMFFPYGSPLWKGVFLDPPTLERVDSILSGRWREKEHSEDYFVQSLVDLSNFVDLVCLQDNLLCYSNLSAGHRSRHLRNAFDPLETGELLTRAGTVIKPLSFHTIDHTQEKRIFENWATLLLGPNGALQEAQNSGFGDLTALCFGSLVETLTERTTYFPGVTNVAMYLAASPLRAEMNTFNLLLKALTSLKEIELKRRETRLQLLDYLSLQFLPSSRLFYRQSPLQKNSWRSFCIGEGASPRFESAMNNSDS